MSATPSKMSGSPLKRGPERTPSHSPRDTKAPRTSESEMVDTENQSAKDNLDDDDSQHKKFESQHPREEGPEIGKELEEVPEQVHAENENTDNGKTGAVGEKKGDPKNEVPTNVESTGVEPPLDQGSQQGSRPSSPTTKACMSEHARLRFIQAIIDQSWEKFNRCMKDPLRGPPPPPSDTSEEHSQPPDSDANVEGGTLVDSKDEGTKSQDSREEEEHTSDSSRPSEDNSKSSDSSCDETLDGGSMRKALHKMHQAAIPVLPAKKLLDDVTKSELLDEFEKKILTCMLCEGNAVDEEREISISAMIRKLDAMLLANLEHLPLEKEDKPVKHEDLPTIRANFWRLWVGFQGDCSFDRSCLNVLTRRAFPHPEGDKSAKDLQGYPLSFECKDSQIETAYNEIQHYLQTGNVTKPVPSDNANLPRHKFDSSPGPPWTDKEQRPHLAVRFSLESGKSPFPVLLDTGCQMTRIRSTLLASLAPDSKPTLYADRHIATGLGGASILIIGYVDVPLFIPGFVRDELPTDGKDKPFFEFKLRVHVTTDPTHTPMIIGSHDMTQLGFDLDMREREVHVDLGDGRLGVVPFMREWELKSQAPAGQTGQELTKTS